ncbi:MAG: choice-of-anchor D domain-containing protein [Alphaproteobacteria bacterium]|nr:choice-of-anchor D domain-containing protein [Alphaproteobacteria bacterium]
MNVLRLAPALMLTGCLGLEAFNPSADSGLPGGGSDSGSVSYGSFGGMSYPETVNFGNSELGEPVSTEVVLTNESDSNITLSELTLDAGSNFVAEYTSVPWVIGSGGQYVIAVTWTPLALGEDTGTLSFGIDGESGLAAIALKGTGAEAGSDGGTDSGGGDDGGTSSGGLEYSTTNLAFGNVPVSSADTKTVSLVNNGSAEVVISNITSSDPAFVPSGISTPSAMSPSSAKTLSVAFRPTAERSYSGTITVTTDQGPTNISVSGTGSYECSVCAPILDVDTGSDPYSMEFGSILGIPDTKEITLLNIGDEDLVVSSVYIHNDSGGGEFRVSGGTGTIAPGAYKVATVSYTCSGGCIDLPLELTDTNILHIKSNDDSEPDWKIQCSGAGF